MKVIKLNDGTIINSYDDRETLEGIIYDYLGSDAFHLFDDYVSGLIADIDSLKGLKDDVEYWMDESEYWRALYNNREDN